MKFFGFAAVLALLLALSACGKKEPATAELKPAATSHEAAVRFVEALKKQDAQALMGLMGGSSEAKDLFRSIISSMEAANAFRERFIKVYGQDAWTAFQAPRPMDDSRPDMKLTFPDFEEVTKEAANWEATTENKGRFDALPGLSVIIKKVKGGWAIDVDEALKDSKTLPELTKTQNALTEHIRKFTKAIGHPGISGEDMDYQMGKGLMRVLMGGEFTSKDMPLISNRFDIETIK